MPVVGHDRQVFTQPRPTDRQENGVRTGSLDDDLVLLCEEEGGVDGTSEEKAAENGVTSFGPYN